MTTPEQGPMSPELRVLLEGERSPGAAPGKDRVRARLDATLFGPPGGGGGTDGGGGAEPREMPTTSGAARLARAAAIFLAGGVVGGVIVLSVRPAKIEIVERRVEVPAEIVTVPVASRPADPVAPLPSASASASVAPPSSVVPAGDTLALERAMLDPARTALGRGDGASALDAANRHAARYGNGKLAEEREAIAVQALVLLHRGDEARARGARFHVRYPGSVLGPAVDAALGTLP